MSSEPCPRCGKNATVTGSMLTLGDQLFQPHGIRWLEHFRRRLFQQNPAARVLGPYRACADCGLVWNDLDPDELRGVIRREGIAIRVKETDPEI
jgi:hypothetical protein